MELTQDKPEVVALVKQAQEGKLCLPDFQRDFVWTRDAVADLVRSMLRGYYIGSLLLLRSDPDKPPFKPTYFRGAKPEYTEPHPEMLVLDGQQRLTSLLYALSAPDLPLKDSSQRRWFFVDLRLLLSDPYSDEVVFDRSKSELDGLDQPQEQYRQRVIPCTRLLSFISCYDWIQSLRQWLESTHPEEAARFRAEGGEEHRLASAFQNFANFRVPVLILSAIGEADTEAAGRVCAIFEKLNSTGVALTVYDLLTARLYRHGIRLHDLWAAACNQHKRLAEWSQGKVDTNQFGVLVLRTLALLRDQDPRPRVLINLKPEGFVEDWERATAAVERALELVEHVGPDGFGVFERKWLPGFGLIPVLAAMRARLEDLNLGDSARQDLRRWYWCNVFLERYSSAVESKSRKDYSEMLAHWTQGAPVPAVFAEAQSRIGASGYTIRDSASYASAVYSGVFCLLAIHGARDWNLDEHIQLQDLQDHHIFPQAYLKKRGIDGRAAVNSVVNRTLISDATNAKIKAKAPAVYIDPAAGIFTSDNRDQLLECHFIERDAITAMKRATADVPAEVLGRVYERFCKVREAAIMRAVRTACGIKTD